MIKIILITIKKQQRKQKKKTKPKNNNNKSVGNKAQTFLATRFVSMHICK